MAFAAAVVLTGWGGYAGAQENVVEYTLFVPGADVLMAKPELEIPTRSQVPITILFQPSGGGLTTADVSKADWLIDGKSPGDLMAEEGHLEVGQGNAATYRAPDIVPPHNPVNITVSFLASDNKKDPNPGKTRIILYCTIYIQDAPNFFSLGGNGSSNHLYSIREPLSPFQQKMFEKATKVNGHWVVEISGFDQQSSGNRIGFALTFPDTGPGNFVWSADPSAAVLCTINCTSPLLAMGSTDCVPHGDPFCKGISLPGKTWLLANDVDRRELRGFFWGNVQDKGGVQFVSGGFVAHY